jgi:hypothetical protein
MKPEGVSKENLYILLMALSTSTGFAGTKLTVMFVELDYIWINF